MKQPKIRFKGFSGEWEKSTIGNISTSFSGGTPSVGVANYYGGSIPFIRSGEIAEDKTQLFLTEEGLNSSSARMVEKGTLLYALYGATSGEVGVSKIDGAINQAILAIIPKKGYSTTYLSHYLRGKKDIIVGALLQGGQGNLSGALVKEVEVNLPRTFEEQCAIANYLDHLDSLIQSTAKKIDSLKQVKAASLQSMFPQEGETTPRIRFKGFEGDWEIVPIKNIASFSKGNGYSKSDLRESGSPIILYGRMYTKYEVTINDVDTFVVPKPNSVYSFGNEVILPASGETPEDISCASAVKKKGIILGGDLNVLKFDINNNNTTFIALSLSSGKTKIELSNMAQGKSVVHLHNSDIEKVSILMPSYAEQQQIASYFTALDTQITLHSQRLEKLKQIKSACLDNMFV